MKKITLLLLLAGLCLKAFTQNIIKANDPHIHYTGRIQQQGDAAILSWSGNSASINFTGSGVKALLKDESGENFLKVIIDGKVLPDITVDSIQKTYTLASGLKKGKHHLELFKRTEWVFGKTWLYQFMLDEGGQFLDADAAKKRKIEFYGNSITCGYAVLDTTGKDRGDSPYEDFWLSYANITARHFNAEYSCIARSGIGVTVSWFPQIMPEMWDKVIGEDTTGKWNFNRFTPDVVVVNLFQNDSWIVKKPQNEEFRKRFGDKPPTEEQLINAYADFIKGIRLKYPNAQIICALGSMDATKAGSPWPGYIDKAVANLHDNKIKSHFFAYKNTSGHPSKAEQKAMADDLIDYINGNIKW